MDKASDTGTNDTSRIYQRSQRFLLSIGMFGCYREHLDLYGGYEETR